jgi:hypothetical protein
VLHQQPGRRLRLCPTVQATHFHPCPRAGTIP